MDAETFKRLFLPSHPKLYRIALRLVESESCAEDMLQDTYLKLWEKRNQLGQLDNPEAFAIASLRNTCLDYMRKHKDDTCLLSVDMPAQDSLSEQMDIHEDARKVHSLINILPPNQRLVMKLKHWEDLTDEEIEQSTGFSSGNIRVLLSRGRSAIRKLLKEER